MNYYDYLKTLSLEEQANQFIYHKQRAEKGEVDSQSKLGTFYLFGIAIGLNTEKAVHWFQKAAKQGSLSALNHLGYCYYKGLGVEQNYEKAFELWKEVAYMDYTDAQYNLGSCYFDGNGVIKDIVISMYWYSKVAEKGDLTAQKKLINYYHSIHEDKKYFYWLQKSAVFENSELQFLLGECYYKGIGIEQDNEKAFELWQAAAKHGNIDAQYNLSRYFGDRQNENEDVCITSIWFEELDSDKEMYRQKRLK